MLVGNFAFSTVCSAKEPSAGNDPGMRKIKDVIIYEDPKMYSSFPSVITRPNGEIIVAFRWAPERKIYGEKGTNHCDPNSYLMMVRSGDCEKWTKEPDLLYAHQFGSSLDPCLLQLKDGKLLCASYGWTIKRPDGLEKLKKPYFQAAGFVFLGGYLVSSDDGGKSWEGPIYPISVPPEINYTPTGEKLPAYNRGALYEGKSGRIFWLIAASDSPGRTSNYSIYSDDKGLTWTYSAPVAVDDKVAFNETSVYETPKGDIVAFLRTDNFDDNACIARSTDGGKSFKWEKMGFQGHPLQALRLPDDRVFLVYGYRHKPFGIRARILNAECTDFATSTEFVLRDDGGSGDLGYPWATLIGKNKVPVTYYFNKDNGTRHIAGSNLELTKSGEKPGENVLKGNGKGVFIIHDDFTNLLVSSDTSVAIETVLRNSAKLVAGSKADYISLCVSLGEVVNYSPSKYGETRIETYPGLQGDWVFREGKGSENIDPYGIALEEIRRLNIPVLAKFRINDRHHVAGGRDYLASEFWQQHPEWYIGYSEKDTNLLSYFEGQPSVGSNALDIIKKDRPRLLDYSVPEVREKRLAIFREVIERYDVAGATLNLLREPFCVSFPEKNGVYLTEFVRQCRRIVNEVLAEKGIKNPILGALLPWDIDFCRAVGMEVDVWISEGLIDYVSPSEGWVTDFNLDIRPWIELTKRTNCAVLPGIVGMIGYNAGFCFPGQYKIEGRRLNSAKIMPEHVRALAYRFYKGGADGLSSFNLYGSEYKHLYPLSELIDWKNVEEGKRIYAWMKQPKYIQWNFLQLHLPADNLQSKSITCLINEDLRYTKALLRFKIRGLADKNVLAVYLNEEELPSDKLTILPNESSGCNIMEYSLELGDIVEGNNQISFSLHKPVPDEIIIQEIEIVVPSCP